MVMHWVKVALYISKLDPLHCIADTCSDRYYHLHGYDNIVTSYPQSYKEYKGHFIKEIITFYYFFASNIHGTLAHPPRTGWLYSKFPVMVNKYLVIYM